MTPQEKPRPKKLHLILADGGRAVIDERVQARLWSKVAVTGGCWWWMGSCNEQGYGVIGVSGRNVRAHRVVFLIANGKCDRALDVCHHCDTPRCVRPDHLFQGTRADNMQDAIAKGRRPTKASEIRKQRLREWWARQPKGTHFHSKLTEQQVREIRARYAAGTDTHRGLAEEYGVSHATILGVVRYRTWKHIDQDVPPEDGETLA